MSTSEAVMFAKNATGFPTNRNAITAAATTKILVLRTRDQITVLSKAMPVADCSGLSARSERTTGTRLSREKSSFIGIGRCLLIIMVDQYPDYGRPVP